MKLFHRAAALAALLLAVPGAVSGLQQLAGRDDCVHNTIGTFDKPQPVTLPAGFDHFNDHNQAMYANNTPIQPVPPTEVTLCGQAASAQSKQASQQASSQQASQQASSQPASQPAAQPASAPARSTKAKTKAKPQKKKSSKKSSKKKSKKPAAKHSSKSRSKAKKHHRRRLDDDGDESLH